MKLTSEAFKTSNELCDKAKELGLNRGDIQAIVYDEKANLYVLFYWWYDCD